MSLNFKNTILFILILCGFLFFLLNAIELNSNYKNIKLPNSKESSKNVLKLKDMPNKAEVQEDNLIDKSSKNENESKSKETIIIVKKGQTFLSILDNFNFKNKKKLATISTVALNPLYLVGLVLAKLKIKKLSLAFFDGNPESEKGRIVMQDTQESLNKINLMGIEINSLTKSYLKVKQTNFW